MIKSNSMCFAYSINNLGGIVNMMENHFMLWRNTVFLFLFVCFSYLPYQNVIAATELYETKHSILNGALNAYTEIFNAHLETSFPKNGNIYSRKS